MAGTSHGQGAYRGCVYELSYNSFQETPSRNHICDNTY